MGCGELRKSRENKKRHEAVFCHGSPSQICLPPLLLMEAGVNQRGSNLSVKEQKFSLGHQGNNASG